MSQCSLFSPKKISHQLSCPSTVPPHKVAAPREETASSHLSLETEIDQFFLEGEGEDQEEPMVQILDSEGELDRSSVARFPNDSSEEEEEMALN